MSKTTRKVRVFWERPESTTFEIEVDEAEWDLTDSDFTDHVFNSAPIPSATPWWWEYAE